MSLITKARTEQLLANGRAQRAAMDQGLPAEKEETGRFSSMRRAVRASVPSLGIGELEA